MVYPKVKSNEKLKNKIKFNITAIWHNAEKETSQQIKYIKTFHN